VENNPQLEVATPSRQSQLGRLPVVALKPHALSIFLEKGRFGSGGALGAD